MEKKFQFLFVLFFIIITTGFSQVKVSGVVTDEQNNEIPFANIVFSGSTTGTVSDENGKFYLESQKTYSHIEVSFLGFDTNIVPVNRRDFGLTIVLI